MLSVAVFCLLKRRGLLKKSLLLMIPFAAALLLINPPALGQSTLGSILGTVKDGSENSVAAAAITITNKGTSAQRTAMTDQTGTYTILNLEPGVYELVVQAAGFQKMEFTNLDLQARETKRVDASLKIASQTETVIVEGTAGAVITTDVSSIAQTKTGRELVDLPVAIYTRSSGSTSPISTLTTQPGIQTDEGGNLSVAGATPALMSYTIDGISSVNVESSGPINELFPSFNSIAEIRVNATNNNAEFSGVSDVTTISKSGTNNLHGGIFENHQNTALNAGNPFTGKPKIIMNDFGGFIGGPVRFPGLYNGRDKTFFFASYEGLRLPREVPIVQNVPSRAMRSGDLCSYLTQSDGSVKSIYQADGTEIPCSSVPVSSLAANVMTYLFPLPNYGDANATANNYRTNFAAPISSNQADLRIDQNLSSRQTVYARFTYKDRKVTTAPGTAWNTMGTTALGPFAQPETDTGLTVAYNFVIKPTLINEIRAGFNAMRSSLNFTMNNAALISNLGLVLPAGVGLPDAAEVPNFSITGFQPTGGANPAKQRSKIIQILDNVTWTKQKHTFKFGGDFRRMSDHDDNVFGNLRMGQFFFDGSSDPGVTINDPFVQFLLGYPDYTLLGQVNNPNMNGLGYSYAVFAQDDWKVTSTLTLNFGLRYELHPPLKDVQYNTAAFLPTWSGTVDGQSVNGAVVVPNDKGLSWTHPGFAASIYPTPILTAKQAGIPEKLRYTDKTDFGPRIGFAWRPFRNDKTVLRGGYGRFIESPLGFSLVSGWAVSASSVQFYSQSYGSDGVTATLAYPSPFPADLNVPGSQSFYYAFPVKYHDPTVQQWNLTFERDLGFNTGLRLSYTGSHGSNLETMVDLNQVPANTMGYYQNAADPSAPYAQQLVPFPLWGIIQSVYNEAESNYNNFTIEANHRYARGLQFQASYSFTRDLSNEAGGNPTGFVGAGGSWLTDRFHPGLDYGNVMFDRRHRFLATYLYELPFGKGKKFLSGSNAFLDRVLGGWESGGVVVVQSGPFLTPFQQSSDPAGTNMVNVTGFTRPDVVHGVSPYASGLTSSYGPVYLNPGAYTIPPDNIGRFGNAPVGGVQGPGTRSVSMSLMKNVNFTENLKLQFGAEVANLFNRRNYASPNMQLDSDGFGTISSLQTAEGAGPRSVQLTARITF
jgi:hypothetical protein